AEWLEQHLVALEDLPSPGDLPAGEQQKLLVRHQAFGYTTEDLRFLLSPMAVDGVEAVGSMGNDTPLAVLSEHPQLLYSYFKQLFAQVTNPPVDAIREELIMAVDTSIGPEGNLLEPSPRAARQIKVKNAVLRNHELETLRGLDGSAACRGFRSATLRALFPVKDGGAGLERALADLCERARRAVD